MKQISTKVARTVRVPQQNQEYAQDYNWQANGVPQPRQGRQRLAHGVSRGFAG